jgi:hypothetical protein
MRVSTRPFMRTLRKLGLAAGLVLAGLVGLECLLRIVWGNAVLSPPIFQSSEAGIRLLRDVAVAARISNRTVQITTDEDGHRLTPHSDSMARSLHLVGDSQVFGWGLSDSETIAAQLQVLLGPTIRVVNHGTPGWGPSEYDALLSSLPKGAMTVVLESEESDTGDAYGLYRRDVVCGYLVSSQRLLNRIPCAILGSRLIQGVLALVDRSEAQRHLGPLDLSLSTRIAARVLEHRVAAMYRKASDGTHGRLWFGMIPWRGRYDELWRQRSVPPASDVRADTAMASRDSLKMLEAMGKVPQALSLFIDGDSHLSAQGAALVARRLAALVGPALGSP